MVKSELVIPRVWRSELKGLVMFFVLGVITVYLSREVFPGTIITGELISLGSQRLVLSLPLLWFIPCFYLIYTVAQIYNVRYTVDSRGVQARVGILSLNQRITRVRYEDIRSVDTSQSLLERMLDIGAVEVSTAATGSVEIVLDGIAAPQEVQDMLQRERDSRQRNHRRAATKVLSEQASV